MTVWQSKPWHPKQQNETELSWNWVIIKFIMHPHAILLLCCVKMSSLKKAYGKLNQNLHLAVNIIIWMHNKMWNAQFYVYEQVYLFFVKGNDCLIMTSAVPVLWL